MKLTESELKIMNIIWDKGSISSGKLIKECLSRFDWKKSTTYTFLKRLEERGAVVNQDTIVTALVSKETIQEEESVKMINNNFEGSLPMFIASFLKTHKLSKKDYEEIQKIIKNNKEV